MLNLRWRFHRFLKTRTLTHLSVHKDFCILAAKHCWVCLFTRKFRKELGTFPGNKIYSCLLMLTKWIDFWVQVPFRGCSQTTLPRQARSAILLQSCAKLWCLNCASAMDIWQIFNYLSNKFEKVCILFVKQNRLKCCGILRCISKFILPA